MSEGKKRAETHLLFVHALSPLHAGTGQGVGVIDLPIAREKATSIPYLPGSSLKGVLRDRCSEDERATIFGPEPKDIDSDNDHASSVQFSDQRLLLLPIRSLKGTFAWVTSPYLLRRFAREVQDVGLTAPLPTIPAPQAPIADTEGDQKAQALIIQQDSALVMTHNQDTLVVLEDLDLQAVPDASANTWATWLAQRVFPNDKDWQSALQQRFCVVHDDVLSFLLNTATEIIARIKLKEDTKTVQQGGLWYEEALPTETLLTGLVMATPTRKVKKDAAEVMEVVRQLTDNKTLQLGGKATIGRGLCRIQMVSEEANSNANS